MQRVALPVGHDPDRRAQAGLALERAAQQQPVRPPQPRVHHVGAGHAAAEDGFDAQVHRVHAGSRRCERSDRDDLPPRDRRGAAGPAAVGPAEALLDLGRPRHAPARAAVGVPLRLPEELVVVGDRFEPPGVAGDAVAPFRGALGDRLPALGQVAAGDVDADRAGGPVAVGAGERAADALGARGRVLVDARRLHAWGLLDRGGLFRVVPASREAEGERQRDQGGAGDGHRGIFPVLSGVRDTFFGSTWKL